jgi:hypothetical protein
MGDDDDDEGIFLPGTPAITAEFFKIAQAMLAGALCQSQLENGPTTEARRETAREGSAALQTFRDSSGRPAELLRLLAIPQRPIPCSRRPLLRNRQPSILWLHALTRRSPRME